MVKLESLKKSYQFKKSLNKKRYIPNTFQCLLQKIFIIKKIKFTYQFRDEKKIGNAVKRNKLKKIKSYST